MLNTPLPMRIGVAALAALVALAVWIAAPSRAVVITPKPAPLGLVGMAEGQTLRVSVANVVGFDPQPDPPGTCTMQVGFADASNLAIGDPHILELRPGRARSFDFTAIGDPSIRQYIRPVVVDRTPKGDCAAVVSGSFSTAAGWTGSSSTTPWRSPIHGSRSRGRS